MNRHIVNKLLTPSQVLIVYQEKGNSYTAGDAYIERRLVTRKGDGYVLAPGEPLSDAALRGLSKLYTKKAVKNVKFDSTLLDGSILYAQEKDGDVVVMWWSPQINRNLTFSAGLKITPTKKALPLPAVLHVLANKKLYLFALKTNERPLSLSTPIFLPPFFNIYNDGSVCLGSANVGEPTDTFQGEMKRFHTGFYSAQQNMPHNQATKSNLDKVWNTVIAERLNKFPLNELRSASKFKTLGDIITKLMPDVDDEE